MKISEVIEYIYLLTDFLGLGEYCDTSILISKDYIDIVDKNQFINFDVLIYLNGHRYDKLAIHHNDEILTPESFLPFIDLLFIMAKNDFNKLGKYKIENIFIISEVFKENQYAKEFRKLVLLL